VNLAEAQEEFANRGVDYLSTDRRTFFLNYAKNVFEDAYVFPWLEAVATGASPKTITDLKQILYVRDSSNDTELLGLPAAQIIVDGIDLAEIGRPTNWWLDGEEIVTVWPVSTSAVLEIRYVKESPELVDPTDAPLIPARYHQTWVDIAMIQAYKDSDNFAAASALQQIVNLDLSQIISRYVSRNRQNPEYQTIRAGSDDW
jgi:hypothetical protein